MCGIAGMLVSPVDAPHVDVAAITKLLGLEMQSRGRDATGIARLTQSGRVKVTKAARPANEFFAQRPGLAEGAKVVLIHTRAATNGSPKVADNNHPIVSGHVVGVHNGIVYNDIELFRKNPTWHRQAEVDSQVIFTAIRHLGPQPGVEEVEGSAAVAWLDINDPGALWLARISFSPLTVGHTPSGTFIFASTYTAVQKAMAEAGFTAFKSETLSEGTMLRVVTLEEGGLDIQRSTFVPKEDPFDHRRAGGTTFGTRTFGTGPYGGTTTSPASSTTNPTRQGAGSDGYVGSAVRSASEDAWIIGAEGWVIRPGDRVCFCPEDMTYPILYGTFRRPGWNNQKSYVEIELDAGHWETLPLPNKLLWPLEKVETEPTEPEPAAGGEFIALGPAALPIGDLVSEEQGSD